MRNQLFSAGRIIAFTVIVICLFTQCSKRVNELSENHFAQSTDMANKNGMKFLAETGCQRGPYLWEESGRSCHI